MLPVAVLVFTADNPILHVYIVFMRNTKAFTLVEILVTVGIVAILAALLLPALASANKAAKIARIRADLAAVASALEAYHQDFGMYPPTGDASLCAALIAPGNEAVDGADGPGFRARRIVGADGHCQGQVYGPYLKPDDFDASTGVLVRNGNAIGYTLTAIPKTAYRIENGVQIAYTVYDYVWSLADAGQVFP